MHLGKAFSILKNRPGAPVPKILRRSGPRSGAAEHGLMLELSIFHLGIIERVMKPTALLPTQRGGDSERCHCRQSTEVQSVNRHGDVPVKLVAVSLKI